MAFLVIFLSTSHPASTHFFGRVIRNIIGPRLGSDFLM